MDDSDNQDSGWSDAVIIDEEFGVLTRHSNSSSDAEYISSEESTGEEEARPTPPPQRRSMGNAVLNLSEQNHQEEAAAIPSERTWRNRGRSTGDDEEYEDNAVVGESAAAHRRRQDSERVERFNLDLPPEHLYLGTNLAVVPGRVILTEGSYVTLPLLPRSYGTLMPGQTFPLTVNDYARTHMLRKCVESDHTFGCIATRFHGPGRNEELIGTTAEIFEFSDNSGTICIKAKARQRFRVIKTRGISAGYFMADVQILPEIILPKPLLHIQLASLNRLRTTQKERCNKRDAVLTVWPSWVYDQYDVHKLVQRVDNELAFLKQGLKKANGKVVMPREPTELSFWIATHLDADERLFVIRLNSPIQRLRWELSLMNKCQMYSSKMYSCRTCQTQVGHHKDVFAMSVEGAQNTYVNPHGFLHETITFRRVVNLTLVGPRSTQYSWFPGYSWCIAMCETCQGHIGWQFVASKRRMTPHKFWGLSRQSLTTAPTTIEHQESDIPVM